MRDSSESLLRVSDVTDDASAPSAPSADAQEGADDGDARPPPPSSSSAHQLSDTRELRATPALQSPAHPVVQHPTATRTIRRIRVTRSKLPDFDPIARLRRLTARENRIGMSLGLAGALLVHGAGAAHSLTALLSMSAFSGAVRSAVQEDVRAVYAVEIAKPPPPPPAPEPEPEKPQVQQKAPSQPAAPQEPPPAPAQAGKVLTAEADPNEPLDLTDQGFVTGEGDKFAGGVTAATGTSKVAVRDTNAKIGGTPGGKGTGAPVPAAAAPAVDLTKPAMPASTNWNDCGFPPEADVEQIDSMRVSVVVTVGVDGRAQNATVLKDPGYGFGRLARQCAMRKTFNVGLDAQGRPVVTTTPPIVVRFTR